MSELHSSVLLCFSTTLCTAQQNLHSSVNVVSRGSPSLILRVLRISLGITILPKSSTLLTIPVAVPDICLRRRCSLASVDRCHSLRSLHLPLAALPSLPSCLHNISFSFSVGTPLLRCPRTPEDGCPYNYFTNYDTFICKRVDIIQTTLNILTSRIYILYN